MARPRLLRGAGDFGEHRGPQGRRRLAAFDLGHHAQRRPQLVELSLELGTLLDHHLRLLALVTRQRVDGQQGDHFVRLLFVHPWAPISPRSRISPSLIRVLTVPSATPRCSAISTWVNPSKYASSSAWRCASLSSVSA